MLPRRARRCQMNRCRSTFESFTLGVPMQSIRTSPFCSRGVICTGSELALEKLEDRQLLSAAPVIPPGLVRADVPALIHSLNHHHVQTTLPLTINSVTVNNGQLVANGTIGANPFTAPITLSLEPAPAAAAGTAAPAATTQVLNLHLG